MELVGNYLENNATFVAHLASQDFSDFQLKCFLIQIEVSSVWRVYNFDQKRLICIFADIFIIPQETFIWGEVSTINSTF